MVIASCAPASWSGSAPFHVHHADELPSTWLTHWRQHEERQRFHRTVVHATRGRQLRRQRALCALVGPPPSGELSDMDAMVLAAALEASVGPSSSAGGPSGSSSSRQREWRWAPAGGPSAAAAAWCTVPSGAGAPGVELQPGARMGDWEWLWGLPSEDEAGDEDMEVSGFVKGCLYRVQGWAWLGSGVLGQVPGAAPLRVGALLGSVAAAEGCTDPRTRGNPHAPGGYFPAAVQAELGWLQEAAAEQGGPLGPQRLRVNGAGATVRPLWISVLQEEGSGEARWVDGWVLRVGWLGCCAPSTKPPTLSHTACMKPQTASQRGG